MALVGKNSEKNNQNLMQLIRRAHGLVENPDLEKHRQSQDHIGELLGNSKEIQYRPVDIDGMDAEWVSVNRAHMKKYVILPLPRRRIFHRQQYLCQNPDIKAGGGYFHGCAVL